MNNEFPTKNWFTISIFLIGALGSFLRLNQIGGQLIGGDEWHAIEIAANHSLKFILTHFNTADNCIPITAVYKLLLESYGLNEFAVRIIPLIAGVLPLFVFPLIINRIFSKKISIIFAILISLSPFLVFYSRYARPYSVVAFLGFLSVLCFYLWIKERKFTHLLCYVAAAVITPYFHLLSFPVVIAPLIYTIMICIGERLFPFHLCKTSLPDLKKLITVGLVILACILLWLGPALPSITSITMHAGKGFVSLHTIYGVIKLFCGNANIIFVTISLLLLFLGVLKLRKKLFLLGYLSGVILFQFFALVLIRSDLISIPLIFARYAIPCLPVWLLFISIGLDEIFRRIEIVLKRKVSLFLYCLLLIAVIITTSPLLKYFTIPNSFTNHNYYQDAYKKEDYKKIKDIINRYHDFYIFLKRQSEDLVVVEAPYLKGWRHCSYHLYQIFHRKKVMIGHSSNSFIAELYPIMHEKISFENFVNIDMPGEVEKSKASYIIIHKDILSETHFIKIMNSERRMKYPMNISENTRKIAWEPSVAQAEEMINKLNQKYGKPFYEDDWIAVFKTD